MTARAPRLAGFVAFGFVLTFAAFFIAWHRVFPLDSVQGGAAVGVMVVLTVLGAAAGGVMAEWPPSRLARAIWAIVAAGAVGAGAGLLIQALMRSGCLHGTAPQERWCAVPDYSLAWVLVAGALAGAFVLFVLAWTASRSRQQVPEGVTPS